MEYNHAAIIITENCNARCRMCCDSRGIVCGHTLTKEEIDLILRNIVSYKYIDTIGFTGGEPMLKSDICEYIMNYDFGRPMNFTIKTNGFWGKNITRAEQFIEKYKEKISLISFSYDEFHSEFINLEYIKNIIDICIENKINTEIVGCFLENGMQPGDVIHELGKYAYLTNFYYQPVIATGSAKNIDKSNFIKIIDTRNQNVLCLVTAKQEYSLLINSKLDVFPCCSQCIENTVLKIGNLKEETLEHLVFNIKTNKILNTILAEGFTPFIDYMENNNITYPKKLSSHCEMCEFLFNSDWFLSLLKE